MILGQSTFRITYSEAIDILNRSSQEFAFPTQVVAIVLFSPQWSRIDIYLYCILASNSAIPQSSTLTLALLSYSGVVTFRQNMRSTW